MRIVSSIKVGTKRRLIDNMSPISWAGTLMILNGVNNFSTASAKLKGVVVSVKIVENTTMRIKRQKITPA